MSAWQPDRLLPGFEALELRFPDDYDGAVMTTLVRLPAGEAPRGAVLYVHGFADYFFQRHMAERFAAEGYAFYALDLRKYGRSLKPHQHPNFCRSVTEYYADLTAAIVEIGEPVLLAGHSTGALICALYAHEGEARASLRALWLNSAFFDWRLPAWRVTQLHLAAALGRFYPFLKDEKVLREDYVRSLLDEGWEFDLALKPPLGFGVYYGWLGAMIDAHARVHRGLAIACPVLSMHSDEADIVLDWRHIARWSRTLGEDITVMAFPGAMHDLVLSRPHIREEVFRQLFAWAERATALAA
ncbi:MAG TPA: alpha/beta hydrolase [Burkholderiales bacterium]|jgi:alpha-beta hydrolase superfamily lysophospholipase|nr:alpha/beta hydrolase [Burkholderiales bacterium]